ncbi:MAG: hypothetical protein COB51_04555 [Moraxellaceae bacterium]|nr:MAG: hypothetical protein COB51_04555 [Moraxellaceae bacterium]
MNNAFFLVALFTVAGIALVIAGIATKRQEERRQRKLKVRQLKFKAADIKDNLDVLESLKADIEIRKALTEYLLLTLKQIPALAPYDHSSERQIDMVSASLKEMKEKNFKPTGKYQAPETDQEVTANKRALNGAIAFLQKLHLKNTISKQQLSRWKLALKQLQITMEVDAHQIQSKMCEQAKENREAIAHLTMAQQLLKGSSTPPPEHKEQIKVLNQEISRLTRSYRHGLTPESDESDEASELELDSAKTTTKSSATKNKGDPKEQKEVYEPKILFPELSKSDEHANRANHSKPIPTKDPGSSS